MPDENQSLTVQHAIFGAGISLSPIHQSEGGNDVLLVRFGEQEKVMLLSSLKPTGVAAPEPVKKKRARPQLWHTTANVSASVGQLGREKVFP